MALKVTCPALHSFIPCLNILQNEFTKGQVFLAHYPKDWWIDLYTQEKESIEKEKFEMKLSKDNWWRLVKLGEDSSVNIEKSSY